MSSPTSKRPQAIVRFTVLLISEFRSLTISLNDMYASRYFVLSMLKVNGPVSGRLTSSGTPPGKSAKSQSFARKNHLEGYGPKKLIQNLHLDLKRRSKL